MAKTALYNTDGKQVGELELSDDIFACEVSVPAMHLVVRSILANQRQGTQSAKTRGEVRGGGRKIYRQKGTGNARHHSNRAPQFTHGGVVFAPKPRDYVVSVPRKVRRLALKSALTSKCQAGEIIALDALSLEQPKTKLMQKVLENLGVQKKALLVLDHQDENVLLAARNIPNVKTAYPNTINVVDILSYDKFIITSDAVKLVEEVYA